jgi:AcrR family transcriptional regulator
VSRESQEAKSGASMAKALEAALELFSSHGFGATSMRQIAERSGVSIGNIYHHFPNKEAIFERLLEQYWERVLDPDLRLNKVFRQAAFPEDLEEMASAIEEVVEQYAPYILLIYVDVIEFRGKHIHAFYEGMASRFDAIYGRKLRKRQEAGELGDVNPMVGVMVAARWFFFFHTVERCFGVPMHFGMSPQKAVDEFIRLLRYGLLPRGNEPAGANLGDAPEG